MFIDTHCHLDLITQNQEELNELIDKCNKEQITRLFNISVDFKSNFTSLDLAQKYKFIYYSVGIHPSEADNVNNLEINKLEPLINNKKCIGIGEIGIDLYRNYSKKENQIELFKKFLELALKYNKPIIIHSREAFKEVIDIISQSQFKGIRGVFHCFSYSYAEAQKCLNLGYKISFAGNLTYKNALNLQDAAKKIPLSEIILETDAPYLTPVPFRGKTNYPYYVKYTYEFLSDLKKIDIKKVIETINNNIKLIFEFE